VPFRGNRFTFAPPSAARTVKSASPAAQAPRRGALTGVLEGSEVRGRGAPVRSHYYMT